MFGFQYRNYVTALTASIHPGKHYPVRKLMKAKQEAIQKSIEQVIQRENYEWQTLRVQEDGNIKVEQ